MLCKDKNVRGKTQGDDAETNEGLRGKTRWRQEHDGEERKREDKRKHVRNEKESGPETNDHSKERCRSSSNVDVFVMDLRYQNFETRPRNQYHTTTSVNRSTCL